MQIICVSRGSYSRGKDLAETLSKKIGYPQLSREEMVEAAIRGGIAVGKLETAILKPHIFNETLALEKEHYQAFSSMYILEKATRNSLIYHGRAAHLLFPGISNILRIRVLADKEYRINSVMQRLNLKQYPDYEKSSMVIFDYRKFEK